VFVNRDYQGSGTVQLAMIDTGTGDMRLVDTVSLAVGAPRIWALWMPDGRHLLTGGSESSYAVNTATLSARPLSFVHGSQDINYSTVFVPPRQ
jgi:hypothetical protein